MGSYITVKGNVKTAVRSSARLLNSLLVCTDRFIECFFRLQYVMRQRHRQDPPSSLFIRPHTEDHMLVPALKMDMVRKRYFGMINPLQVVNYLLNRNGKFFCHVYGRMQSVSLWGKASTYAP